MLFSLKEITSVTLILFAIIDILGQIPFVISLRNKNANIESEKATLAAGLLMIAFLFLGEELLKLIGIDVASFATAGSIVIFIIALEMILGVEFFKSDYSSGASTFVPLAFPMIAGAGTLTTLLSIRAEYKLPNIIIGIIINLIIVYLVLRIVPWLERKLGVGGVDVLRRSFGVILLAIAVKLFKSYSGFFTAH